MRAIDTCKWPLTALLLTGLLAACGGGSDSSPNGAVTPTPVAPVTPPPGAPSASGDTASDGFAWFNFRRNQVGLSTLTRNSVIDRVALGHSNYQRLNNTVSHDQVAGNPGFTGQTLLNRLNNAGYHLTGAFAYGEVISAAGERDGFYHAEELIAAIYHRFVVFEPLFREMGTGAATNGSNYTYFTTDFSANNGYGPGLGRGNLVTYPVNNQLAVPPNFLSDSESPDPVPNQNEVGYPISIHADATLTVTVSSFTVRPRGGADLATRLLSKAVDGETPKSAAAVIPLTRLAAGTTYDVSFSGTVDGSAVTRNWSFTTR